MNSVNAVDWDLLLDTNVQVKRKFSMWSNGQVSTREMADHLRNTEYSGEFRKLVRNYGTTYGRRLARKALSYRNVVNKELV